MNHTETEEEEIAGEKKERRDTQRNQSISPVRLRDGHQSASVITARCN